MKSALELRGQNFLIKPDHDDLIYAENAKAAVNPWRARHCEEEKSFCRLMGFPPVELLTRREDLRGPLMAPRGAVALRAGLEADKAVHEPLAGLSAQATAKAARAWGAVSPRSR